MIGSKLKQDIEEALDKCDSNFSDLRGLFVSFIARNLKNYKIENKILAYPIYIRKHKVYYDEVEDHHQLFVNALEFQDLYYIFKEVLQEDWNEKNRL